ncbi:MAG: hypothetical protein PHT19_15070 [Methylococcus sp.]|nr:hypothetical protein [Methylococcus sp.]
MIKIKTVPALILGWLAVSGAASAFPAGNTQWELRMNIDETLTRICRSPNSYSQKETRSGGSFRKALISFGTDASYEIKLGESQTVISAGTYKQEGDALTLTPNEEWLPLSTLANYPGGGTIVDKVKSYAPKKLQIRPKREEFTGSVEAPPFSAVKLSLSELRRYRFAQTQGLQTCTSTVDVNLDAFGTYQ